MNTSSYEQQIINILRKANVSFIREKTFSDLKKGKYRFDFYLPLYNCLLEIDGQFHFKPIRGRAALLKQKEHDRQKNSYCLSHNINLYRIPYWELENIKYFSDLFRNKYRVYTKWHNDYLKVPK